jgi:hypothetical protein
MEIAGGVCFEESARSPKECFDAAADCAKTNLRLPTAGELFMFRQKFATAFPSNWTEPESWNGTEYWAETASGVKSAIVISAVVATEEEPYRCVTLSSN